MTAPGAAGRGADARVVVILGGSGGLGQGLARRWAADGCRLVLADIEQSELDRTAGELTDAGHEVAAVWTDIADRAAVDTLARTTFDRFGRADVVCNTVGVTRVAPTWELSDGDWRWQMDVNFWGCLHVVQAFVPGLMAQGHGHLVLTSSTATLNSHPGLAAYTASKNAVMSLAECLQQDLRAAGSPLMVSVVLPGVVRSRLADAARNRQGAYGVSSEPEEVLAQMRTLAEQYGADPDVLAGIVVDKLEAGCFYVVTRPSDLSMADRRLEDLHSGLLSDAVPMRTPGPGAHVLHTAGPE